ncbi:DUF2520 domain-containing protein [bacterium]|nr:DUF2520 domain-containing protein [bacterium]
MKRGARAAATSRRAKADGGNVGVRGKARPAASSTSRRAKADGGNVGARGKARPAASAASRRAKAVVAIVGAGRAGGALAAGFVRAGFGVRLWDRDPARARRTARAAGAEAFVELAPLLDGARLVVVAVGDDALKSIAGRLARAWPASSAPRAVLHTAGARDATPLAPLRASGAGLGVLHPVVGLLGPRSAERLAGATATVSGDPAGLRAARAAARALGMVPLAVDDARRPLVHLAAVFAAGDLTALLGDAEDALRVAGCAPRAARALLAALAAGAVANYRALGAARALTGPVARGDAATLAAHLAAARRAVPDDPLEAHLALARSGARRLARAGALDAATLRRLLRVLASRGR